MLWSFSVYLEAVAILPQLFMLSRTGEAETITTHYIFALGSYRALYILNWIWRYFMESHVDYLAWICGLVQTGLYADFFYIYFTRYGQEVYIRFVDCRGVEFSRASASSCQHEFEQQYSSQPLLFSVHLAQAHNVFL